MLPDPVPLHGTMGTGYFDQGTKENPEQIIPRLVDLIRSLSMRALRSTPVNVPRGCRRYSSCSWRSRLHHEQLSSRVM